MSGATFATVRAAARGRWPEILAALGIAPDTLTNRNKPCPGCGGRDRFRFDDKDGDGTWICGGGGELQAGDGFALLCHVRGVTPSEALATVAAYLGIQGTPEDQRAARARSEANQRAEIEEAVLVEIYVLASVIEARAHGRQLARDARFRALRPEFQPMPAAVWDREKLAARRIVNGLGRLYGR